MRQQREFRVVAVAIAIALGSAAASAQPERGSQDRAQNPQGAAESSGTSESLDRLAEEHDDLSAFVEAVKAAGLADALTGGTEYTIFAPTNDALESMPGRDADDLASAENREELTSLLRAHIVADDVDEEMARTVGEAVTIDGGSVELSVMDDKLMVDEATVEDSPIELGNLRIYRIDGVLSPDAGARVAEREDPSAGRDDASSQADPGDSSDAQSDDPGRREIARGEDDDEEDVRRR